MVKNTGAVIPRLYNQARYKKLFWFTVDVSKPTNKMPLQHHQNGKRSKGIYKIKPLRCHCGVA